MHEAAAPLLQIAGLRKCYGDFSLDDVSLQVPEGCVVGLVGANGAGKSTIIKCILGLTKPDSGSISLFGEEIACMSQADFVRARSKIGVVFDSCTFPDVLSVGEVAQIARRAYPDFDPSLFWGLIGKMGVPGNKRVKELSRGMGMKLSIALALAARPELLILDEATAGLDPLARGEMITLLRDCMLQAEEEGCGVRGDPHVEPYLRRLGKAGRLRSVHRQGEACFLR
ncbi:MAG: ABC transporter ATP-binding protein [Eggerthellaceae bacterium]